MKLLTYRETTNLLDCLLIFCLLSLSALNAQTQEIVAVPSGTLVEIEGRDYYLEFKNSFEYAGVEMVFGDIVLKHGGTEHRVKIAKWEPWQLDVRGTNSSVEQDDLRKYSRSETFTIPEGGPAELQFYRRMGMWAPCSANPPGSYDPLGSHVELTPWDVSDKTEWSVQLCDATSGEMLMDLNTAGIDAHNDPASAPFYGDAPRIVKHSVKIPAAFAGRQVYVQVVTRRWGGPHNGLKLSRRAIP